MASSSSLAGRPGSPDGDALLDVVPSLLAGLKRGASEDDTVESLLELAPRTVGAVLAEETPLGRLYAASPKMEALTPWRLSQGRLVTPSASGSVADVLLPPLPPGSTPHTPAANMPAGGGVVVAETPPAVTA